MVLLRPHAREISRANALPPPLHPFHRRFNSAIDRALNKKSSDKRKGRILVELRLLEARLHPFPTARKGDLLQDLEDLYSVCEGQLSNAEGIHVMDRIWRTSLLALTGA